MINKKNTRKTPIIKPVFLGILLLALVGASIFIYHKETNHNHPDTAVSKPKTLYSPPTAAEKQQVQDSKTSGSESNTTPPPDNAPSNPQGTTPVVILSATQDNNKNLIVKTELNGLHWDTCSLSITNGGQTLTKNTDTLYQSQFSTCTGYVIQASELSAGDATLTLTAKKTDGSTYKSDQKVITIVK